MGFRVRDEEELGRLLDESNQEAVNAVISGEIEFGEPEEAAAPEATVNAPNAPAVEPIDQAKTDPISVPDSVAEIAERNEELRREQERLFKQREDAFELRMNELARKQKEFEDRILAEKEKPVLTPVPQLNLEEEDGDIVSSYERNTRKQLEQIANLRNNPQSDTVMAKLEALEKQLQDERDARKLQEDAEKALENTRNLYREIDGFIKGKPEYELPMSVGDVDVEQKYIRGEIGRVLGYSELGEIERVYRSVVKGDTVLGRSWKDKLAVAGVKIPDYAKQYVNVLELNESHKGKRFNMVTGKYEDSRLDLETLYRAQNISQYSANASIAESKAIQGRLNEQRVAAVVLPNTQTSDASGDVAYTEDEISAGLDMHLTELNSNPVLAKKVAKYFNDIGRPVPAGLKA